MKSININGIKVAYKVTYYLNCAIVTVYVKHRVGQEIRCEGALFENYKTYSRGSIYLSTIGCDNEYQVVVKATASLKIIKCIKPGNPAYKMFIKELYKALE